MGLLQAYMRGRLLLVETISSLIAGMANLRKNQLERIPRSSRPAQSSNY